MDGRIRRGGGRGIGWIDEAVYERTGAIGARGAEKVFVPEGRIGHRGGLGTQASIGFQSVLGLEVVRMVVNWPLDPGGWIEMRVG